MHDLSQSHRIEVTQLLVKLTMNEKVCSDIKKMFQNKIDDLHLG